MNPTTIKRLAILIVAVCLCTAALGLKGDSIDPPMYSTDFNDWVSTRISDDAIRKLCRSGEVCRVIGHAWQLYLDGRWIHEHVEKRKCAVCGKIETLQESWK